MVTLLIIDDEARVLTLVSDILSKQGYSLTNAPQAHGLVKLVRKLHVSKEKALNDSYLDLADIFVKYRSGKIYKSLLLKVEKPLIEAVLKRTDGNKMKAAKLLGINRNTLNAKIKKLEIDVNSFKVF